MKSKFDQDYERMMLKVLNAPTITSHEWQAKIGPDLVQGSMKVLWNQEIDLVIPHSAIKLQEEVKPNLPWAEDHFKERVGGEPLNPGEQYKHWPWYRGNVEEHKQDGQFSHTYMERFWPKYVSGPVQGQGLRYNLGDLWDVVNLLRARPLTRQAYLPVWFPEDTGATHGERVPCSLGYQFFCTPTGRDNSYHLNCNYYLRSCDLVRYLRDDVYMAARLTQWVGEHALGNLMAEGSHLTTYITNLHVFDAEVPMLRRKYGFTPEVGQS